MGGLSHLGDVARVELGAQDYVVNSYLDGKPAVAMVIQQRPGSNALATAERVRERMRELSEDFPQGHRIPCRLRSRPSLLTSPCAPSFIRSSRPRCWSSLS